MFNKVKKPASNSRSKSKGSKHHKREQSAEQRPHKVSNTVSSNEYKSKLKTQNSVNRHKTMVVAGQSRMLPQPKIKMKKPSSNKNNNSHTITDRKQSPNKLNKTEVAHYELEDIQHKMEDLKDSLRKIELPRSEVSDIRLYYKQIQKIIHALNEPLHSLLMFLHEMYLNPLNRVFEVIIPFENLLMRRETLTRQIELQTKQNQRLYEEHNLNKQNLEINQLKDLIEQQRLLIEQKKDIPYKFEKLKELQLKDKNKKKDFKIDLENIQKNKPIQGFHDEFYSKIQEFSESWRNQALRQKRF